MDKDLNACAVQAILDDYNHYYALKISRTDLIEILGISYATFLSLESGKSNLTFKTVQAYAKGTNQKVEDVLALILTYYMRK